MRDIVFNDWKIDKKIGAGQNSEVYLATKKVDDVVVQCAIKYISLPNENEDVKKLIASGTIKDESELNSYYNDIVSDIKKEFMLMKKFEDNPNFINCYEYFQERKKDEYGADLYIRMELVKDLNTHFSKRIVDEEEVLKLGLDICNALELCEKRKIFHRDIKPSNIFYGEDGNYKLGDFGVSTTSAFIGEDGKIVGTYAYMSKEAYNKEEIDSTTDIYSLGLVMYKLLNNNKLPFESKTVDINKATEMRLSGKKIPRIDNVSSKVMNIILKACKYDSKDRYQNVSSFKNDIIDTLNEITPVFIGSNDVSNVEKTVSVYNSDVLEKETVGIKELKNSKKRNDDSKRKKLIIIILFLLILILFILVLCKFFFLECKDGYVKDGVKCVKGYYYCEEGYNLNDKDKCVKVLESVDPKVTYLCSDGFVYNNGKCIKTDTKSTKDGYSCGQGYTLKDGKCVKETVVAATMKSSCSSGYQLSNNQCVKTTTINANVSYSCSSGYTLSGTICKRSYYDDSKIKVVNTCPSNCTLNENTCDCKKNIDYYFYPYCSSGTYNYVDKKCHYTEKASTSYSCTNGSYKNNSCYIELTIGSNKKYSCSNGYTLSGTSCIKKDISKVNVTYSCSNGYILKGSSCYMTSILEPVKGIGCDEGYTYNGKECIKQTIEDSKIDYSCSKLYEFNEQDKMCVKYKEVNPKIEYEK